jgi:hypothetical protein
MQKERTKEKANNEINEHVSNKQMKGSQKE